MNKREIPIDDAELASDENLESEASDTGNDAERVAKLEQENQTLRNQLLAAVADLENFRRRTQQERQQIVRYANESLWMELLPVIDDFRRSVEAGAQTRDFDAFYKGVQMINDKIGRMLDKQEVKRMETIGQPFDVHLHEAVMQMPSDAPEGTIINEVEPGYMYGDKVLRHAKVILSAGR